MWGGGYSQGELSETGRGVGDGQGQQNQGQEV